MSKLNQLLLCSLVVDREGRGEGRERSGWQNFRDAGCIFHVHIFYSFSWTGGSLALARESFCSVIFVMNFLSDIFQVLHVCPETKRNKIRFDNGRQFTLHTFYTFFSLGHVSGNSCLTSLSLFLCAFFSVSYYYFKISFHFMTSFTV